MGSNTIWTICGTGLLLSLMLASAAALEKDTKVARTAYREESSTHKKSPQTDLTEDQVTGRTKKPPPNLMYHRCLTINDQIGRCRPVEYCRLPEMIKDFATFKKYFCVINAQPKSIYGLCCPNQVSIPESTVQNGTTDAKNAGCGISSKTNTRIVGGELATIGEFPWMVSFMDMNNDPFHFCGGTLISPTHIISAAHCFTPNRNRTNVWARLAEFDYTNNDETDHVERRISKYLLHPNFNPSTYDNDISLVTLDMSLVYNDLIRPICLPPPGELFAGSLATTTGWGVLTFKGNVSEKLMKVKMPIWSTEECINSYNKESVTDSMLCAGVPEGGKDSCQDDSGGPLLVPWKGKWTLAGIVSWGHKCALPGRPGVYTRVTNFLGWIQDNMS